MIICQQSRLIHRIDDIQKLESVLIFIPTLKILIVKHRFFYLSSNSRIFHSYGDVTIAAEGLQNLDLCVALMASEQ